MFKVHARGANDKVAIKMSKRGQPVGDRKVRAELSNFLGTLVKDHVSITYVNWHVVPEELKKSMLEYTLVTSVTLTFLLNLPIFSHIYAWTEALQFDTLQNRYIIPQQGEKWVFRTLNSLWRTHKSRTKKKYYTKYDNDDERIQNRPDHIPLEEFKMLLKYWSEEGVKVQISMYTYIVSRVLQIHAICLNYKFMLFASKLYTHICSRFVLV